MTLYDELVARGLIAQVTDEEEIKELINNGKATFYIGFDPTADSLHVGHFMALCLMKRLQQAGNKPIALIGGGTAMIGDPSGRTDMRQMMTPETIQHNCDCFKKQMSRFIDFSDGKALMVNNADWLMDLNYIDVLREVGAHFSVNRMLTAECYKQRMEKGLSFLEFNYMIMQSYDFYTLFQKYGCNMEFGGDDQWSNMLGGTELIRRKLGKDAYAMTINLLLNSEGKKMGKTQSGAVWLDPEKTSPFDFFQYWRNVSDSDVLKCIRMLTFLPLEEIDAMESWEGAQLNQAKEILAFELTKLVHGEEEAQKAQAEAMRFAREQEAAGIRAVGEAEASAIQAKGIAEAEAMEKKAEAYAKYNKAAVAEMMIKVLPDIAGKVAEPLGQIDKITIIGGGEGGSNGVDQIAGNVPVVMAKVFESMKEATGIDLADIINAESYGAKVNRNVNVSGLDSVNFVVKDDGTKVTMGQPVKKIKNLTKKTEAVCVPAAAILKYLGYTRSWNKTAEYYAIQSKVFFDWQEELTEAMKGDTETNYIYAMKSSYSEQSGVGAISFVLTGSLSDAMKDADVVRDNKNITITLDKAKYNLAKDQFSNFGEMIQKISVTEKDNKVVVTINCKEKADFSYSRPLQSHSQPPPQ